MMIGRKNAYFVDVSTGKVCLSLNFGNTEIRFCIIYYIYTTSIKYAEKTRGKIKTGNLPATVLQLKFRNDQ